MRSLKLLFACSFVLALSASAQSASYTDPKTGVSFQYPSVWKQVPNPQDYLESMLVEYSLIKPVFVVEFSPEGNLYEHTNLTGLAYLYFAVPASDVMACAKLGDVSQDTPPKPTNTTIHGIHFQHSKGGDAGMSHQLNSDVYSVYRGSTCYLFEEVFRNVSRGVIEGAHDLTSAQTKALQHHLEAITRSIVFTKP